MTRSPNASSRALLGLTAALAGLGLAAACTTGPSCADITATNSVSTSATRDVCPPPTLGRAQLGGTARRADGTPLADRELWAGCGEIGVYDTRTDARGRFTVQVVYAADTLSHPAPPRAPDGTFTAVCGLSLVVSRDEIVRRDTLTVRFAPPPATPPVTTVELIADEP